MLDLNEWEVETDDFAWTPTAQQEEAEPEQQGPMMELAALRSRAMEALSVTDAETDSATTAVTVAHPDASAIFDNGIDSPEVPPLAAAELNLAIASTDAEENVFSQDSADVAVGVTDESYATACLALFNEKFPDGIGALFSDDWSPESMFSVMWGKGLDSGSEAWTATDCMLMDAVVLTLQRDGIDLDSVWQDLTGSLYERLFPNGLGEDGLASLYDGNGPISGLPEWTNLDFKAIGLLENAIGQQQPDENIEHMPIVIDDGGWFFPMPVEIDGEGFGPIAIATDDCLIHVMPIVVDCTDWMPADEGDAAAVIGGCEVIPPPEPVICLFPVEDMAII